MFTAVDKTSVFFTLTAYSVGVVVAVVDVVVVVVVVVVVLYYYTIIQSMENSVIT